MNRVVLLGTNHSVQRGEFQKSEFYLYLVSLCQKENIRSIAEEIDENAISIVAKQVCNKFSINHLMIDPKPSDYQMLGITPYNRIQYEVMSIYDLDKVPSDDNNTPTEALIEFESRVASDHNLPREQVWLNRILTNDVWPVLVICGANHFKSFCNLLTQNGVQVTRCASNWCG